MADLLSESTPAARKPHRCNYCGGVIAVGDRYVRAVFAFDGSAYTWKAHPVCDHLGIQFLRERDRDEGLTAEDWWEHLLEIGVGGLVRSVAGAYSSHHPDVHRLAQRLAEHHLPRAYSTSPRWKARTSARRAWHPHYRGELVEVPRG